MAKKLNLMDEFAAKGRYIAHTDNHPTIHSNRFPTWDELSEEAKDEWRRKATEAHSR